MMPRYFTFARSGMAMVAVACALRAAPGRAEGAAATGAGGGRALASPARGLTKGLAAPTANRLSAAGVVERVQKRYDAARDFRAKFTQTLASAAVNRKTQSAGEVLLKKPGLMRWNYHSPEERMYLSDGRLLWLYEPEDRQAFKQDLKTSQLPAALVFLTGTGKLAEQFDITLAAPKEVASVTIAPLDYVLSLRPRRGQPQIKTLLFVVDSVSFDVRTTIITDAQGNQNQLSFSDIRTNTGIPADTFHWTPPAGVRVVDTAKLGN